MSKMQGAIEAAVAAVPSGKAIVWIGGTVVVAFFAGIGWDRTTLDLTDAVAQIPAMEQAISDNTRRLGRVESTQADQGDIQEQILCLVRLIANGEDPGDELNPRCP